MKNLNLTPRAQKLVKEAHALATEMNHDLITRLHFFIAFLSLKNNQIQDAFENFDINVNQVEAEAIIILNKEFQKSNSERKTFQYTKSILSDSSKNLFKIAKQLSTKYDHKYIGLEHIFISLFEDPDSYLIAFLENQETNYFRRKSRPSLIVLVCPFSLCC